MLCGAAEQRLNGEKKKTLRKKKTRSMHCFLLPPQSTPFFLSPSFLRARVARRGSALLIRGGAEGEEWEVKRRTRARKKRRRPTAVAVSGGRRAKKAVEFDKQSEFATPARYFLMLPSAPSVHKANKDTQMRAFRERK